MLIDELSEGNIPPFYSIAQGSTFVGGHSAISIWHQMWIVGGAYWDSNVASLLISKKIQVYTCKLIQN